MAQRIEKTPLGNRIAGEAIGTGLLLACIVGSGIMAHRLAAGNVALALLANSIATGGALFAIIVTLAPISGAHLNPAITLAEAWQGRLRWREAPGYVLAQITGAIAGVGLADLMFGEPIYFISHRARDGFPLIISEVVATFGLVLVVRSCSRYSAFTTAAAVAAYIVAAFWFTASTSFANPAVTLARSFSDTFAGIAPADVPGFIAAELVGAAAATAVFAWLSVRRPFAVNQPVLFVCVHNSARSQMAEAFLTERCPNDFAAESAGIEPGTLHPLAVAAMSEVGIDISSRSTQSVFDLLQAGRQYSYVITVCDESSGERCPIFPGQTRWLHWNFPDPSALTGSPEDRLAKTRLIRDQIRTRIDQWCSEVCHDRGEVTLT